MTIQLLYKPTEQETDLTWSERFQWRGVTFVRGWGKRENFNGAPVQGAVIESLSASYASANKIGAERAGNERGSDAAECVIKVIR